MSLPLKLQSVKKKRFYFPNKTVYIFQGIEIKEGEQGEILWRNCGYKGTGRITKYDTQFGEMTSDDMGEFGGVLYTPFGNIDGNFVMYLILRIRCMQCIVWRICYR